ncbi:MAG: peptide MFS transporter, partial [Acidobacteriota bacterium]
YGMRGFLILYMTAGANLGGLGLSTSTAAAVYGTYTSMVYLMSLPGGWIADRLLGQRRAVLYGGLLIAAGHYTLAVPTPAAFYAGLTGIVLGTGLLKPNISVIVGQLYAADDDRRDAGFSLFYMGINLGAFVGPLLTGFLAQDAGFRAWLAGMGFDPNASWHWGFGAAGVGMTLGLVQYMLGSRRLGEAGMHPAAPASPAAAATLQRRAVVAIVGSVVMLGALAGSIAAGWLPVTPEQISNSYGYLLLGVTVVFFGWLFLDREWTSAERKRLYLIGVFFVAAALFFSVFEQAGSTLNLFADRASSNTILGRTFPSSWYQSLNALFIIAFAPVFAWLWVRMGHGQPASPTKFSFGLVGVGLGFLLLVPASRISAHGIPVSPLWLTATYLVHTFAELCLSPVGLSSMTKLAPPRIVSLMMGVWFLGASVGNFLGGLAATFYESMPLPQLFTMVALLPVAAGVLMFLFRKPLTSLIGDAA